MLCTIPNKKIFDHAWLPMGLRFGIYTILIWMIIGSLPLVLEHGEIDAFKEGGWIEYAQLLLLMVVSSLYFCESFITMSHPLIYHFLGYLAAFAAIRELDSFFDNLIPLIGWKIGFIIVFFIIASAYHHRMTIDSQMRCFLQTHAIVILWAGFLIAVPIGQSIGHGAFLEILMGDDYTRAYKRVMEETLEFIGYLILFLGSIECVQELKTADPKVALKRDKRRNKIYAVSEKRTA